MMKMHHKHNNNDEIKIKMKHSDMFKWQKKVHTDKNKHL